jgi:hypothetical protein
MYSQNAFSKLLADGLSPPAPGTREGTSPGPGAAGGSPVCGLPLPVALSAGAARDAL